MNNYKKILGKLNGVTLKDTSSIEPQILIDSEDLIRLRKSIKLCPNCDDNPQNRSLVKSKYSFNY